MIEFMNEIHVPHHNNYYQGTNAWTHIYKKKKSMAYIPEKTSLSIGKHQGLCL